MYLLGVDTDKFTSYVFRHYCVFVIVDHWLIEPLYNFLELSL